MSRLSDAYSPQLKQMKDWISRFFRSNSGDVNSFYPPASEQAIRQVEQALGIVFPGEYKAFLLTTNGFEGWIGEFYAQFEPVERIIEETQLCCGEFFPWAIFLGSNRNLEMLILDTRENKFEFGLLPNIGDEKDFISSGPSFEQFIERLYTGMAFIK